MKNTSRILSLLNLFTALLLIFFATQAASMETQSIISEAKLKGHGIVKFQGSGTISINGEGAIFIGKNGRVDLTGLSSFFENAEDGKRVYIIPESDVKIAGDDLDISFYGADFGFIVTATSASELYAKGYGYYKVGLSFGVWTSDGVTFSLGN